MKSKNPRGGNQQKDPALNKVKRHDGKELICLCNSVSRATIEDAIRGGAKTLNEIFDQTSAGVGPCGGSCRRKLAPILEHYLKTGDFPESAKTDGRDKKKTR